MGSLNSQKTTPSSCISILVTQNFSPETKVRESTFGGEETGLIFLHQAHVTKSPMPWEIFPFLYVFEIGAVDVTVSMSRPSFWSTRTAPAVTMSLLSAVVFVGVYCASSFCWRTTVWALTKGEQTAIANARPEVTMILHEIMLLLPFSKKLSGDYRTIPRTKPGMGGSGQYPTPGIIDVQLSIDGAGKVVTMQGIYSMAGRLTNDRDKLGEWKCIQPSCETRATRCAAARCLAILNLPF